MRFRVFLAYLSCRQTRLSVDTVTRRYMCYSRRKAFKPLFEVDRYTNKLTHTMENHLKKKKFRNISRIDSNKRKFSQIPVSFNASVSVISSGANGLGRSVLLRTNNDRYLFNCAEGVQKVLPDISNSLGPVDNIFFTYNSWDNVGGIMGFLLSNTEDIFHANKIVLHGPPYVNKLLDMTKMFSEGQLASVAEVVWHGIDKVKHEDSQLTAEYVELRSGKTDDKGTSKQFDNKFLDLKKTVMNYIIKLKPLPRKVDVEKLMALNTKSGPWVQKLVNGEDVILPDGREVKPEDVLLKEEHNFGPILVIDCPTEDYLDSLCTNQQLLDLQSVDENEPVMIIHMAPATVIEEPRYKTFMDRHQSGTIHLMLNENSPGPYVHSSQSFQSTLNYLEPEMFPALQGHYKARPEPATGNIVQGCSGLIYRVRPESSRGFNWEDLLYLNQEEAFTDVKKKSVIEAKKLIKRMTCKDTLKALDAFKESDIDDEVMKVKDLLNKHRNDTADLTEEYPELVFLGTGSAKPGLYRNASAILVQMRKDKYFLLECGEGTLLQLYQMYGIEKTNHILRNLKGMFISHLHFDHHGGMFGVLEARRKVISQDARSDRLTVFASTPLKKWITLYSSCVFPIENCIELVPHHVSYVGGKRSWNVSWLEHAKNVLDVSEFAVMPVVHSNNAYGISFRHQDGWKLVYSGDTMPCKELVRYGKDCDILIHEATFDSDGEGEAAKKKHSTASQAIQIGKDMNAKFTLLTHFSQRFSKIPKFDENFTENVGFAFDFMQLRPSQLRLIHLLKPALTSMFGHSQKSHQVGHLKDLKKEAYFEKAGSERKLADKIFMERKRDTNEQWAKTGRELKSKLLDIEQKAKLTDQKIVHENDEVKEDEKIETTAAEVSYKRKIDSESVVNKSKKTHTDVNVATTSNFKSDLVEQDDTLIGN